MLGKRLLPAGLVVAGLTVLAVGFWYKLGAIEVGGFLGVALGAGISAARWPEGERPHLSPLSVQGVVLGLYLLACLCPAICCDEGGSPVSDLDFRIGSPVGLILLLSGWLAPLPWSANVVLVAGLVCLRWRRFRAAALLGTVATVLGLTTWMYDCPPLRLGYYLWQFSFLALALGAGLLAARSRHDHVETQAPRLSPTEPAR